MGIFSRGKQFTEAEAVRILGIAGFDPLEPYPGFNISWKCVCKTCGQSKAYKFKTIEKACPEIQGIRFAPFAPGCWDCQGIAF